MGSPRRLAGCVVALTLLAAGCSGSEPEASTSSDRFTRSGELEACPQLTVGALPAGVTLQDRELPNLGGGRLGRLVKYGDGSRIVALHVGIDPLEALEDLDFEAEALESGGRRYAVSRTPLDPALVVASWTEDSTAEPCDELALMARGFSLDELVPVLDSVSLSPRE